MLDKTEGVVSATTSAVIVRACVVCGGKRELDKPCTTCGNKERPVTHDLGIQSAYYKDPVRQAWWFAVGQHLAANRARRANEEANRGNRR